MQEEKFKDDKTELNLPEGSKVKYLIAGGTVTINNNTQIVDILNKVLDQQKVEQENQAKMIDVASIIAESLVKFTLSRTVPQTPENKKKSKSKK